MGGSRGKSKTQRGTAGPRVGAPKLTRLPLPRTGHTHWAGRWTLGRQAPWTKTSPTGAAANGRRRVATLHSVGRWRAFPLLSSGLPSPGQSLQGLAAAYLQVQEALQLAWRWMHHSGLWCGAVPGQPYTRQGNGSQGRHNGGHEGETYSARLQPGNKYIITALSTFLSFLSRQRPTPRADIANPRCEWSRPMSPDKTACVGRKPGLDPAPAAESRFPKGTCGRPRKL